MTELNAEQARFNMIEQQIRTWNVLDPQVLELVATIPRESFVSESQKNLAFADLCLPIGHDQVMMPPKLEARILQSLSIRPQESILEIGTGSGYLTACLAKMGKSVTSVDIHKDFTEQAQARLEATGIRNATLITDDVYQYLEKPETFDVVVVTGSIPLMDERFRTLLNPHGRMFIIVGEAPAMDAMLIARDAKGEFHTDCLFETVVPALVNAKEKEKFQF